MWSRDRARALSGRCPWSGSARARRRPEAALLGIVQAEIVRPRDLVLAHRDAADDLGQIFGERRSEQQAARSRRNFSPAPCAGPSAPSDRWPRHRSPARPARARALLALQCRDVDLAAGGDFGGDGLDRAVAQGSGGFGGLVEKGNELRRGGVSMAPDAFRRQSKRAPHAKPMIQRPRKRAARLKSNRNIQAQRTA